MSIKTTPHNDWQTAFAQWKVFAISIRARALALDASRQAEGWKLAASVGIDRNACSLHNASIDDNLTGWCARNPERLKVAKQANYLVNRWDASRLADRIIKNAWNRLLVPCGACKSE